MRELMPNNFFLIPGFGAQGGSAKEAQAGFAHTYGDPLKNPFRSAAIVNSSRGLFAKANEASTVGIFSKILREEASTLSNTLLASS